MCCGSGIRCLFDHWIRDPGWVKKVRIKYPRAQKPFIWVKILEFFADPGSGK
jgi:hypothetical protein